MENDVFLSGLPLDEFRGMVEDALRSYNSDIKHIYLPLASSSLIVNTLMAGDTLSIDLQRIGMSVLLRWGIATLRQGSRIREDRCWRLYFSLWNTYIMGKTFEETAESLGIVSTSIYDLRREAITQLSELLQQELVYHQDRKARKELAIRQRYAERSDEEQQALNLLAIFDEPLTWQQAQELLSVNNLFPFTIEDRQQEPINRDLMDGLLCYEHEKRAVEIHPEARPYIIRTIEIKERLHWYVVASEYHRDQLDYLSAATYLCKARRYDDAVLLLWEHHTKIIDAGDSLALRRLLAQFRQHKLSHDNWMRTKLLAGQLAFELENAEAARVELSRTLEANNIALRAQGYCYLAQALVSSVLSGALMHYDQGIQLVTPHLPNHELEIILVDLYIGKAWLYIQERQNLDLAQLCLTKAQDFITPNAHLQHCKLFNAWAQLNFRMNESEKEFFYRVKALLSAIHSDYRQELAKTLHNLGQTLIFMKQKNSDESSKPATKYIDEGIKYLQQGQKLAAEIGNRKIEAKCFQAIGAGYFFLEQYDVAIVHYRHAHNLYEAAGHNNWLGHVCYDLAEAYAKLSNLEETRRYFEKAKENAQWGFQDLTDLLNQLAETYPEVKITILPRQQKAIEYIDKHGCITTREYCQITGVSNRTAYGDLAKLVQWGILIQVGQGRGARYERTPKDT